MDVIQILQRSLSGCVFVLPAAALWFFLLKKRKKPQSRAHIAASLVFLYYLVGVFTVTGIGRLGAFSPRLVLLPFRDMISGPVDTALNVFLFAPLGFFLPLMYKSINRLSKAAALGFLLSLAIELLQMFCRGSTDINDLITNTAGACLGFGIYKICASKRPIDRFWTCGINDLAELSLFALFSLITMLTAQPVLIHALFGLG